MHSDVLFGHLHNLFLQYTVEYVIQMLQRFQHVTTSLMMYMLESTTEPTCYQCLSLHLHLTVQYVMNVLAIYNLPALCIV